MCVCVSCFRLRQGQRLIRDRRCRALLRHITHTQTGTQTHTVVPGAVLWPSEALVLVFPHTYYPVENTKSVYTHASGRLNITVCDAIKVSGSVCVCECVGISRLNHDSSLCRLRVCREVFYLVSTSRAKVTPPPTPHPLFTCLSLSHTHTHMNPFIKYLACTFSLAQ